MRVFIAVLVLIFSLQSLSKADDISDFEIEGISVGDSLLNFMNIEDIKTQLVKNDYTYNYTDKKFISIKITGMKSELYDKRIIVEVKRKNDLKYIIYSVRGEIIFPGMSKCLAQKNKIVSEIQSMFTDIKKREWTRNYHGSTDDRYKIHGANLDFNSGDTIGVICSQFPENLTPKRPDSFYVFIRTKEFEDWLAQY